MAWFQVYSSIMVITAKIQSQWKTLDVFFVRLIGSNETITSLSIATQMIWIIYPTLKQPN